MRAGHQTSTPFKVDETPNKKKRASRGHLLGHGFLQRAPSFAEPHCKRPSVEARLQRMPFTLQGRSFLPFSRPSSPCSGEISAANFTVEMVEEGKVSVTIQDPLTSFHYYGKQLSIRDIFKSDLQYKISYYKSGNTGKVNRVKRPRLRREKPRKGSDGSADFGQPKPLAIKILLKSNEISSEFKLTKKMFFFKSRCSHGGEFN